MALIRNSSTIPVYSNNSIGNYANAPLGNLVLNGTIVDSMTGKVSFIDKNYYSTISITSTFNISNSNFTIIGTSNGCLITETIAGPNNNTVFSNTLFDSVSFITISNNVINNAFSIGSNGDVGFLANYNTVNNYSYNEGRPIITILIINRELGSTLVSNSAVLYGVCDQSIGFLTKTNSSFNINRNIKLDVLAGGNSIITSATLNAGLNINPNYPYYGIYFYIPFNVRDNTGGFVGEYFIETAYTG